MVRGRGRTPKDIVERLHGEIKDFMVQREIRDQIARMDCSRSIRPSVASLHIFVRPEIARWGKLVEQAGIAGSQ